jgi:glucosyl-3-phosphoglycerate phosphatase
MKNLYVVAHPEAQHTVEDVVGGWYNSRLTSHGRAQADRIGKTLARRIRASSRPAQLVSSDLSRCAEAAEIVGRHIEMPARLDIRLREISFGEAEGRPNFWLAARQVPAPDHDRLDHRGPISGAETRREVATRVSSCVQELMADLDHDFIVMTHGYAHTFVVTAWLQLPIDAVGFASFATSPGAITHLQHDDYWRNRSMIALADTAHLKTAG